MSGFATRPGAETRALLPLLDRLIDDRPDLLADPPLTSAAALAQLRRSVQRDLEALLNARRRWRAWPDRFAELAQSPVGYGIPDFAAGAFNDPRARDRLRGEIEDAIRRFEPRLSEVRVQLVDGSERREPTLRLRIEAVLHAAPAPEPVAFDTLVDANTASVSLRERTHV